MVYVTALQGRVSISSTGCKVLNQAVNGCDARGWLAVDVLAQDTYTDKVRVETLIQGLTSMQESINQARAFPARVFRGFLISFIHEKAT